jgi:hypothetical protein
MKLPRLLSVSKNRQHSNIYDVSLTAVDFVRDYSELEISFYLYPYSRKVSTSNFQILPYEDYAHDVSSNRRSTYKLIKYQADKLFGIVLGLIIILVLSALGSRNFNDAESIVAILATYAIGKELFVDFDNFFINLTKAWRTKWLGVSYSYQREDFGTVQRFWKIARNKRNQLPYILPRQFEYISHSNSKTIDMIFSQSDLKALQGPSSGIASIEVDEIAQQHLTNQFMFGVKITLVAKYLFWKRNTEIFQAIDAGQVGTVTANGSWATDQALVRSTFRVGRLKYYRDLSLIENLDIIDFDLT